MKIKKKKNENDDIVLRFDPCRVTVHDRLASGRLPTLLGLLLLKGIDFRYRNKLALQKKNKKKKRNEKINTPLSSLYVEYEVGACRLLA